VVSVALSSARRLGFTTAGVRLDGQPRHLGRGFTPPSLAGRASPSFRRTSRSPKIAMTAIFAARVLGVEGNYDDVNRLCVELVDEHPDWAFANINLRPFYSEGSKTLAFEISEQLGWRTPDQVVVPVASGSQLTKVAKGFKEFIETRASSTARHPVSSARKPRAVHRSRRLFHRRRFINPSDRTHRALVGHWQSCRRPYVRRTAPNGGDCGSGWPDDEILECIELLAKTEGVFPRSRGSRSLSSPHDQSRERSTATNHRRDQSPGHGSKDPRRHRDTATVVPTIKSVALSRPKEALRFSTIGGGL